MAADRLSITVHGMFGTTELGTRRTRTSSIMTLEHDDGGVQPTGRTSRTLKPYG